MADVRLEIDANSTQARRSIITLRESITDLNRQIAQNQKVAVTADDATRRSILDKTER